MKHIIVTVTNGTAVIRGALVGQKKDTFRIKVLEEDAPELSLERPQWKIKSVEHTYQSA